MSESKNLQKIKQELIKLKDKEGMDEKSFYNLLTSSHLTSKEMEDLTNYWLELQEEDKEEEIEEEYDDEEKDEEESDDDDKSEYDEELSDLEAEFASRTKKSVINSTKNYLKSIGEYKLLSLEEEREVAKRIMAGNQAKTTLEIIQENPNSEKNEEDIKNLNKLVMDGKVASDELFSRNLRLVVSIAKRYVNRGIEFDDLIQEGNDGLMRAVEKFDPTKGFRFSTYATWWIRQSITRAIADQGKSIRIPIHVQELKNKITKTQRELVQTLGREPSSEEIAKAMGGDITVEKVEEMLIMSADTASLDSTVGDDEDSTLEDFVEDKHVLTPEEYVYQQHLKEQIQKMLKVLDEREEIIIRKRYGLEGENPLTLEEIGKEFGITKERVRQIEERALRKIKKSYNRDNL